MTEEISIFLDPLEQPKWTLSGYDEEILQDLIKALRTWLADVQRGEIIVCMGKILISLEDLIDRNGPPKPALVSIKRAVRGDDGLEVCVELSPYSITLSAFEYIWTGQQGHDHTAMLNDDGRPLRIVLTPMGSFDRIAFARWLDLAETTTDQRVAFDSTSQVFVTDLEKVKPIVELSVELHEDLTGEIEKLHDLVMRTANAAIEKYAFKIYTNLINMNSVDASDDHCHWPYAGPLSEYSLAFEMFWVLNQTDGDRFEPVFVKDLNTFAQ